MRQINEVYREKKAHVEKLNEAFSVAGNIKRIEYARDPITGEEVVIIIDSTLRPHYVLVTANSLEATLDEICLFALNKKPTGYVEDFKTCAALAKLFYREGA